MGLTNINHFQICNSNIQDHHSHATAITCSLLINGIRKKNISYGISDILWFLFFAILILSLLSLIFGFGNIISVCITFVCEMFVSEKSNGKLIFATFSVASYSKLLILS